MFPEPAVLGGDEDRTVEILTSMDGAGTPVALTRSLDGVVGGDGDVAVLERGVIQHPKRHAAERE